MVIFHLFYGKLVFLMHDPHILLDGLDVPLCYFNGQVRLLPQTLGFSIKKVNGLVHYHLVGVIWIHVLILL